MINFKTIQQSSIILIVTFLCAFSISAYATEFHVTTSQELQTALSTAAENNQSDSIFLAAGTYKGNFRFETEESDTSISIQAEEGLNAGNVILDGEERDRVLLINSNDNNLNVSFYNITIKNGKSFDGGGINIQTKGNVKILTCSIYSNSVSQNGGGLYIKNASEISILKTNISSNILNNSGYNSGYGYGGGLYITGANDVIITDNNFSDNSYVGGNRSACISINAKNVTVSNNKIINNSCYLVSGLIINASSSMTFEHNFISKNIGHIYSSSSYGVLNLYSPEVIIKNNQLSNNQGTIYINSSNTFLLSNIISKNLGSTKGTVYINSKIIKLTNNLITKNVCGSGTGCGVYVQSTDTVNINSNTISENSTQGQNAGLYLDINNDTVVINIYNNIIWNNKAEKGGGDIYLNGYGSKKNFYNNNVHDIVGTFDFAANNIDVAPLFINTEKDDFHLGAGSLCINAGTNDAPELPALDMDGNPRIGDDIVDIGAYEHSSTDYHPADTNNDWSLSSEEVSAYETAWKNGNTWSTGPSQIPMNYLTRAGFIHQSGSAYKNAGGAKPLCWIPVE
jgi:hypothetical protein